MTPEKYRRLKPLFEQALDTPPGQRPDFILKIRMMDDELGRELESLVEQHTGDSDDVTRAMDAPLVRFDNVLRSAGPSFSVGEMLLDRFRIVRFIDKGGMGEVYEAEDKHLGRIAIKTIRPHLASRPEMMMRFSREVQLSRRVGHTGVCRIHELFPFPAGEKRGAAALLTMEYLEGETLARRIKRKGALSLADAEAVAIQLCAGVQAIHDAGVLHRDIKCSNIMLASRNGTTQAVVMDLGLARESAFGPDDDTGLTTPGAIMGTRAYMAPELLKGAPATAASDVFAIGVVLFEMVTGTLPPDVREGSPSPSASFIRRDLPAQWDVVIGRCMEFSPDRRFQSAGEIAAALGQRPRRRVPRLIVYAAAAVVLAAITAGVARSPLLNRSAQSGGAANAEAKTMVVLPFENLGGDAASQAFCDGLQETTTSMLSQASKLRNSILVVPSSELRRYQVKTIADARKVFNANLALTGTVQKNGDALQLTLNLNDAQSMRQQDSRILVLKQKELAGLQRQLADQIDSLLGGGAVQQQLELEALTHNSEAYRLYTQGEGALQQGRNLDEAVNEFQKAVALDPQFALATAKLAEACVRKYLVSKDTKWLAQADSTINGMDRNRQIPEALFAQAMVWRATGETDKAIPLFRQLLEARPNDVEAWDNLAETLKAAGKNEEAEEIYQKVVRLRPGYWPAYNRLAAFYMDRHEYARAEQSFIAGIGVAPGIPTLHANLGGMYFTLSRWDDAERELRKSIALRPSVGGYSNLGTVLFYKGQYSEAARQFEEAIKLQPTQHVTWGNLGDARWQLVGESQGAREAFEKAYSLVSQQIILNPADAQLRKSMALYLAKLGHKEQARQEIEAAIQRAPKDMYVRFYAARVYAVIGDLKDAAVAAAASLALGYDPKEIDLEPDLKSLHLNGSAKSGDASRQ